MLKSYFFDKNDSRDRLGAEFGFLKLAWERGIRNVPEPIISDVDLHIALLSFVGGRKLESHELTIEHISMAIDFVVRINELPPPRGFPQASEACFRMLDHRATVDARIERLSRLDKNAPFADHAETLIRTRLLPAWEHVRRSCPWEVLGADDDVVNAIISPSDFGFHNALAEAERLTFLDFEYAGLDDPAKLICDFFCQPEVPVGDGPLSSVIEKMQIYLDLGEKFSERTISLLPPYRIKWACIMLNEFVDLGRRRRAFSGGEEDLPAKCERQINAVGDLLDRL
ncbi:MAG: phosphotransferase [Parvibaculum sp.]